MNITIGTAGEALVVSVSGELDLHTAREFRVRVDAELDRFGSRHAVLDFSDVGFIDSSGLGALLGRYRRVGEKGGEVVVCRPRAHVRRLLELAGVNRIIRIYGSLEEALTGLGQKETAAGGDCR